MNKDWQATVIKIAAVVTAMPRWVGALLAAEGLIIPPAWGEWWVVASAIMSASMAIVEGWAFAYVFEAWRNQKDKQADRLLQLAGFSAVLFVLVLAPYIAAGVAQLPLGKILKTGFALYVWSAAVAASTIAIVASVGYAQKRSPAAQSERRSAHTDAATTHEPHAGAHVCGGCGAVYEKQQQLAAHKRFCKAQIAVEPTEELVIVAHNNGRHA